MSFPLWRVRLGGKDPYGRALFCVYCVPVSSGDPLSEKFKKLCPNINVNTLFLLKLIKVLAMFKIWWTSLKQLAFFEIREYFS